MWLPRAHFLWVMHGLRASTISRWDSPPPTPDESCDDVNCPIVLDLVTLERNRRCSASTVVLGGISPLGRGHMRVWTVSLAPTPGEFPFHPAPRNPLLNPASVAPPCLVTSYSVTAA